MRTGSEKVLDKSEACVGVNRGGGLHQVFREQMAVHAHVGPPGRQVAGHPPWARPEVLEGVLRVDAALDRMPLPPHPHRVMGRPVQRISLLQAIQQRRVFIVTLTCLALMDLV